MLKLGTLLVAGFISLTTWANDLPLTQGSISLTKVDPNWSSYLSFPIDSQGEIEILSQNPVTNPDFFSWNHVLIKYCSQDLLLLYTQNNQVMYN